MASPHIAGIVALMKSKDPSLTPAKILQIMCDNAEDIDAPEKMQNRDVVLQMRKNSRCY